MSGADMRDTVAAHDAPDAAAKCAECGAVLSGPFCAQCGLRATPGGFTLRRIGRELLADALDLDRGVLFTLASLLRRPGATVRAYLAGRTGRYTNPFKYLLLCLATVAVAWWLSTHFRGPVAQATAAEVPRSGAYTYGQLVGRYSRTYGLSAWALLILFSAAFGRLVFRRAGLTFAEHLLFATYTCAQIVVLAGIPVAVMRALPPVGSGATGLAFLAAAVWYVIAATAFSGDGVVRGLPRAVLVLVLSVVSYVALGLGAISVAMRLGLIR